MNIREIAKLAGVSVSTVSRYLNNGYLSDEKRKQIKLVIEETGYQPSAQAQMLRTKKTKLVGVILPKIDSESVSRIAAGISQVLSEEGYQILLANTENNTDKEIEYLNLFKNNNVDGIIFVATIFKKEHKNILKELNIPVIVVGQKINSVSCIYHDDFNASRELTDIIIKSGKKNIGYIGVTLKDKAAGAERKKGFLSALKSNNIEINEYRMIEGDFSIDSGYQCSKKLLSEVNIIDAIFCATDYIAIGAMKYIKEIGIKIPNQIAVTGIGHTRMSEIVTPKLTTAHYYYKTSGIEAAKLLISLLKEKEYIVKKIKLGYKIINNESV